MTIKDFNRIYPPMRLWRKLWLGLSGLPILPTIRNKYLKICGIDTKGCVIIYGGVIIDSVISERMHIDNNMAITYEAKLLKLYLDPTNLGNQFRIGDVFIREKVLIAVNSIICNSVTIGDRAIIGARSIVTKNIPPYEFWGTPAYFIKKRAKE